MSIFDILLLAASYLMCGAYCGHVFYQAAFHPPRPCTRVRAACYTAAVVLLWPATIIIGAAMAARRTLKGPR